ncbi:hypothetical protein [Hyphomonas sp.]|uniref:hypothetical protein n=1 Tax=Hyphomonas sp. TaxID=87 RepID=UPI0025BA93A1|nr:hypothetical protein [Hyphomonas sp.]
MEGYVMMSDKDCIDLDNYLDDLRNNTREIPVNNYITHHVHAHENGHDIIIVTGDEKDLKNTVAQKFMCRWPKNKNPRTKPFTHAKKEV